MTRRPPITLIALAAALTSAACGRGGNAFGLFARADLRPATDFAALDVGAVSDHSRAWACRPIWSGARSCAVRMDAGMLTALVGANGRVIRFVYVTDEPVRGAIEPGRGLGEAREILQNEVYAMRVHWDSASAGRGAASGAGHRWSDEKGRWSAGVWYSAVARYLPASWTISRERLRDSLAPVPDSMAVTDERAYAALMAERPLGALGATAGGKILPGRPLTAGEQFEMMRGDLAMFADAQAEYRRERSRYAVNPGELMFLEREGVAVMLLEAGEGGWAAVATHSGLPASSCVLHAGRVRTRPRTLHENLESRSSEVVCDGIPYTDRP